MENLRCGPQGFQRNSRQVNKRCLELLLSLATPQGNVLDVGCGTGNSLLFVDLNNIEQYIGIDQSKDKITYANLVHAAPNVRFIISDFLTYSLDHFSPFDAVVCAACLQGFIPQEQTVIDKLSAAIRPGGDLFLSCALDFDYLPDERFIQERALMEIRHQYPCITEPVVFDDFRFSRRDILDTLHDFDMVRAQRIEETVEFENFSDFRDWHWGASTQVRRQFDETIREQAITDYYQTLYAHYCAGRYKTAYSTGLMLLRKKGD
ncbi:MULTISPECIES: class I SAM-dependent methyltransferase [Pseudomonas]|jgi:SAM-dependent methyltransferase|uniref:Class I SAM-dependent methyltransferase n=1 Tax=Pseudomonas weihenstephanensis TaxID=1608994 RepID=A0ABS1ZJ73_9PSED|nr:MULTISPECIES: class I SAM-dependent methyltransferase [Pseudomonas]KVV02191.1 trans-aconitate 2-methyltransferase [Pseudomonas sp. TAD18]KVV03905.1 trans-aconitate 2-methyltransferase [Pseudomonas sp. TAA207]MBM1196519.1 class I SAM-dependent methyltransferase [Pseudomonas weihenstephanensis]